MLWLITSVVLNVKVKLCWMGSFATHVSSISLNCVICIMLNSTDDFFEEQSMQLFVWLNCVTLTVYV